MREWADTAFRKVFVGTNEPGPTFGLSRGDSCATHALPAALPALTALFWLSMNLCPCTFGVGVWVGHAIGPLEGDSCASHALPAALPALTGLSMNLCPSILSASFSESICDSRRVLPSTCASGLSCLGASSVATRRGVARAPEALGAFPMVFVNANRGMISLGMMTCCASGSVLNGDWSACNGGGSCWPP